MRKLAWQLATFMALLIVLGKGHFWLIQHSATSTLLLTSLAVFILLLPFLFITHLGLCHFTQNKETHPAWWVFALLVMGCVVLALVLFNLTPWGDGYLNIIYYYPVSQRWLFWLAGLYGMGRMGYVLLRK